MADSEVMQSLFQLKTVLSQVHCTLNRNLRKTLLCVAAADPNSGFLCYSKASSVQCMPRDIPPNKEPGHRQP